MATKPTAAIARLLAANNGVYDEATNPYGLDEGGHRQNWVLNAVAEVSVAQWAEALASEVADDVAAIEAAYDAIQAGPVISVVGRSGAVTAAQIKTAIGLDAFAADLQNQVDTAIAAADKGTSPFTFSYAFR